VATLKLTDKQCVGAKAEPGKRVELWDTDVRGLCLRVSDEAKVWVYRYRRPDGSQPRLKLGAFTSGPVDLADAEGNVRAYTLAGARARARKLRTVIDDGGDPAGEKRRAKAQAKAEPLKTFGDLIETYFRACERGDWQPKGRRKRASTIADERRIHRVHLKPAWESERLDGINRAKVRSLLRGLRDKGLTARTNRAHALIRQAFAYAISEERLEVNPALNVEAVVEEKPRSRVLRDAELKAYWLGLTAANALWIERPDADPERVYVARPMAIILQLAALLLQRRSEISGMRVAELDLDHSTWLVPAERMKGGRAHMVPLPPRAVELVKEALKLRSDPKSPCVFPGRRSPAAPIRGDSVTHSFGEVAKAVGLDGVRLHDLRRTGATVLTSERLGVAPFIRSQVLGHSDAGGGSAVSSSVYDWNTYLPEKRKALAAWGDLLLEIVGERERPDNVRQFPAERG
jgi:integrase